MKTRVLLFFILFFTFAVLKAQEEGNPNVLHPPVGGNAGELHPQPLLDPQLLYDDSDSLIFPIEGKTGGIYLDNQIKYDVEFNPILDQYILWPKIGNTQISEPIYLSREEYLNLISNLEMTDYYMDRSRAYDKLYRSEVYGDKGEKGFGIEKTEGKLLPSFKVRSKVFETIFGGDQIQLIPQGFASLDLGLFYQKIDNPQLLPQNRKTFTVDLQQRIQMSVLGKVGENLQLKANYDTQAGFGFENQMKIQWRDLKGGEDNIVQSIEVGNISMPLSTSLITGAQSLFGVRTDLRFGKTDFSLVFSEQKSEARNIRVEGGGVVNTFKIYAENYDYNRHFFLGQYFRNQYNRALSSYPTIISDINITRIEVWRIDRGASNQQERRIILALSDLAENGAAMPENNTIYSSISNLPSIRQASSARAEMNSRGLQEGTDYIVHENVRKLSSSEYTYYPSLGYISLNQPLVDGEDLLAVSFQYTKRGDTSGKIYKVGEMSDEQGQLLITKLIKPNTVVNTQSPMWNLMMKNIYSINSMSISSEDFMMNVEFKDNGENSSGTINYLPSIPNKTLLQIMKLDRLNQNGDVQTSNNGVEGDGLFDFLPGITVDPNFGTIIFPVVEPFGENLSVTQGLGSTSPYVFEELYTQLPNTLGSSKLAQRYSLSGRYKGGVSDGISLGAFNVPQGSVKVTASGQELLEGIDYTVDYQLGQVTILNQQIKDSGVPIDISLENQSTFNLQKKRFIGLNVEHKFSENFLIGGTLINYQERPYTQKAQYGSEPVNNTIFGLNTQYNGESEFLTRLTNKIPGIKTDQISQVNFSAEGAYLLPGTNNAADGRSYIDDFESAQMRISMMDPNMWRLGSTPGKPAGLGGAVHPYFPNGTSDNNLDYGNGRRLMSWYSIDPRFYGLGGGAPSGITSNELSLHKSRRVLLRELFDVRDAISGNAAYISTFDMTFYPEERGPYNVNPGVNDTENWGAITRPISVSNFIDANIEYIEFWMMDPYADGDGGEGELLIHLGSVSEDVLKDGEMMYENGMPYEGKDAVTTETNWGKQPSNNPIVYAYDTEGNARKQQDLGYNGLTDEEEATLYGLLEYNPITGELDPAADNYLSFFDKRFDGFPEGQSVTGRYKYFRGVQGNNSTDNYLDAYSMVPDSEDVNGDYNLDQTEYYNQYTVKIDKHSLINNSNGFIVAQKDAKVNLPNGQEGRNTWYQFRIPVDNFDALIDGMPVNETEAKSVLTSARFMRMVMRGFEQETTLRFGAFDLVRSSWRRYEKNIYPMRGINGESDEGAIPDEYLSDLEIGEVSIEQNSTNEPPYVMPPGIRREQMQGTTGYQSQNEASMVLKAKLSNNSPSKGVFRNVNLDMRRYKKMEMYIHAEDLVDPMNSNYDKDTKLFIRMGSDFSDNYYEYEIPLKYTAKSSRDIYSIWPDDNKIDIKTDFFVDAKTLRDSEGVSTLERFSFIPSPDKSDKVIYVKGRPSLGNVSSLMIGLRTTGGNSNKEVLVWVNELLLSEIDNEGGYAATANVGFTLGDFANIQVSGSISSAGFGAIDQGPSQRNQEEIKEYSVNAQFKLDKFMPKKWGMEIPFSVSFSEQFIDPKYNPLDNDVEFDDAHNKDELKDVVRTYSQQKSFNFSNIRKIKTNSKRPNRFYDPSNFSLSFMYGDDYYRDIYTTYNLNKTLRASLNYNYSFKPLYLQPFKNWRAVQDTAKSAKYLNWVKEVNFNPVPTRFSFRTEVNRTYTEQQFRDINQYFGGGSSQMPITYSNNFLFTWQYNLGFDLTKSLRLDLSSSTRTLNDGDRYQKVDRNLIWSNLFDVGRPINYDQRLQINYKFPFHLFPYLNWMNVEAGFTSDYSWQARSSTYRYFLAPDGEEHDLGNIAQNSNNINLIGDFNLSSFYEEFSGYNRLDSIRKGRRQEIDSLTTYYSEIALKSKSQRRRAKSSYKFKNKYAGKDYVWMFISSIKRVNFNYNQINGAVIPGILSEPNFFGFAKSGTGPDFGFIYGTNFDIKRTLIENGITSSEYLTESYQRTRGTNFSANAFIEPISDLRIDLSAKRASTFRMSQNGFNVPDIDADGNKYYLMSYPDEISTLNSSNISIGTSFKDPDKVYQEFLDNTQIISERLGRAAGSPLGSDGYYDGYGIASQEVLVPAFISAVEGRSAKSSSLGHNRKIPLPNWNISYTGLTRIPTINKVFDQVEIYHAYLSSYTANGIQSNPNYFSHQMGQDPFGNGGRDLNDNFITKNIYSNISMIESFSPLLGISVTFRNNLQLRAQYNRDRLLTLSLSNYTLTEDYGDEYIFGLGYIIKDVKMKFRYQGRQKTIQGDLNVRADVSLRDNETRIRRILDNDSQLTGGQRLLSVMVSADYSLSEHFSLRFYWDQMVSEYKVSTAYPISSIRAGLSAIFTFGN